MSAMIVPTVRGCLLGWYGWEGDAFSNFILRSPDPAGQCRELADRLLKLAKEIDAVNPPKENLDGCLN